MKLKEIKDNLSKDIEELGYHLYSLKHIRKDNILEVLIDETLDLDEISKLSKKVSKLMDKYDDEFDSYTLDVASAGSERNIYTLDEAKAAVGKYVHVKTLDFEGEGILKSYNKNGSFEIEYLDKNKKKVIKLQDKDVVLLRHAVKF